MLDVSGPYSGDDGDLRPRESRKRGNLATMIHSNLPDSNLILEIRSQDRERQSDLVVEISDGGCCAELTAQDRCGEILSRCFPTAASHHHRTKLQLCAPC